MNDDRVPLVLVCVDADDPATMLGTVTLGEEDMSTRPDLAPWVADCLTLPAARGRGVAALLVQLVTVARSLGQQRIYLWTEHEEACSGFGWRRSGIEYAGASSPCTSTRSRPRPASWLSSRVIRNYSYET